MASQDWFEKDFYATLGVAQDASEDEIKKAYRKLARTWHPDKNPGDAAAEQKFKDIGEAHQVLADPEQRQQYDAVRQMARGGARFGGGAGGAGVEGGGAACGPCSCKPSVGGADCGHPVPPVPSRRMSTANVSIPSRRRGLPDRSIMAATVAEAGAAAKRRGSRSA